MPELAQTIALVLPLQGGGRCFLFVLAHDGPPPREGKSSVDAFLILACARGDCVLIRNATL